MFPFKLKKQYEKLKIKLYITHLKGKFCLKFISELSEFMFVLFRKCIV